MSNKENINIGNSGEYFAAGELERRGFTVALPMSNVKDFDILVRNRNSGKKYTIQVKTTKYKQKLWTLKKKNEEIKEKDFYYIFVALNNLEEPEYHIVPSKIVADTIREDHKKWLATPGKKGQQHKDTTLRKFSDLNDEYLDRWDYLK